MNDFLTGDKMHQLVLEKPVEPKKQSQKITHFVTHFAHLG